MPKVKVNYDSKERNYTSATTLETEGLVMKTDLVLTPELTDTESAVMTGGNATAADIRSNKTAYVGGSLVTGSMPNVSLTASTGTVSLTAGAGSVNVTATNMAVGTATTTAPTSGAYITATGSGTVSGVGSGKVTVGTGYVTASTVSSNNSSSASKSSNTATKYYPVATATVQENPGTLTTATYTQGYVSVPTAGYISAGTKVTGASFKNSATSGKTYKDISNTNAAPILVSDDYLYIDKGYTDDVKISLAKLVPDGASDVTALQAGMLPSVSAYDGDGKLVTGNMPDATCVVSGGGLTKGTASGGGLTGGTLSGGDLSGGAISGGDISGGDLSGGGLTAGAGEVSVTAGSVTPKVTGTAITNAATYGITTTKPSGTDGTAYLTFDPDADKTVGKAKGRGTVNRAAITRSTITRSTITRATVTRATVTRASVTRAAFSQPVTRAAVTDTHTAGYLEAGSSTPIAAGTTTVTLAAGTLAAGTLAAGTLASTTSAATTKAAATSEATSATSSWSDESNVDITVNGGTNYYIPIVSASATAGTATATATTSASSATATVTGMVTTTTNTGYSVSASATSGTASASSSATGGSASVGKGITAGASASGDATGTKSASSSAKTASTTAYIQKGVLSAGVSGNITFNPSVSTNMATISKPSTGTEGTDYYSMTGSGSKTGTVTGSAAVSTEGYVKTETASGGSAAGTIGSDAKLYVAKSAITNNTSGGTSSGTINAGSQIKFGAGYNPSDLYYTAAADPHSSYTPSSTYFQTSTTGAVSAASIPANKYASSTYYVKSASHAAPAITTATNTTGLAVTAKHTAAAGWVAAGTTTATYTVPWATPAFDGGEVTIEDGYVSLSGSNAALSTTNSSGVSVTGTGDAYIARGSVLYNGAKTGYINIADNATALAYWDSSDYLPVGSETKYVDNITVPSGKTLTVSTLTGRLNVSAGAGSLYRTGKTGTTYINGTAAGNRVVVAGTSVSVDGTVVTDSNWDLKTANPAFDGGDIVIADLYTTLSGTNASFSGTNNSGIAVSGVPDIAMYRNQVLYNGAVAGWVNKADNAVALGYGDDIEETGDTVTLYINSVTVPSGKTFSVNNNGTLNSTINTGGINYLHVDGGEVDIDGSSSSTVWIGTVDDYYEGELKILKTDENTAIYTQYDGTNHIDHLVYPLGTDTIEIIENQTYVNRTGGNVQITDNTGALITANPTFNGGGITASGSATNTGSNVTLESTNNSGVSVSTGGSLAATRASVLYAAAVNGFVNKSSGTTALAAASGLSVSIPTSTVYINNITVPSGKTLTVTTVNGVLNVNGGATNRGVQVKANKEAVVDGFTVTYNTTKTVNGATFYAGDLKVPVYSGTSLTYPDPGIFSASTGTTTVSISGNVTTINGLTVKDTAAVSGSGTASTAYTNTYLAKWNSTSSITTGPRVTISTATPTGGSAGDIHYQIL